MMTYDKKALIGIFVLVFPLLVLGGLWAKAATHQTVGQQIWQVKITGYDPRDPLYGHYLRYRIDWDIAGDSNASHLNGVKNVCMCLNSSGNGFKDPSAYPVQCNVTTTASISCESVMEVHKFGNRYALQQSREPERFFIPEENSHKVDSLFRDGETIFRMELMAHKDHSVSIRGLYVDDIPLDEYLRKLPHDTAF